ncbi:MAG TPA: SCO1664 family protein [Mycobacteriales bacterium]|nr:SCO1664 family protein [Mycobacteriales bacterium]
MSEPARSDEDSPVLDEEAALQLLADGELTIIGRLVDASNTTLFGHVEKDGVTLQAVYKPIRGERPLWDFPHGTLAGREVATYLVSAATPWAVVPPTILRDGPFGPGMVQVWIDVDDEIDLGELVRRPDDPALRRIALLDAVLNNADRKGGHLLPVGGGHVFGCDHGLTFSTDDKLRTVLWQWRGCPLAADELAVLTELRAELDGALGAALSEHLRTKEIAVTIGRIERLLSAGTFPFPSEDWPAVPWPPF